MHWVLLNSTASLYLLWLSIKSLSRDPVAICWTGVVAVPDTSIIVANLVAPLLLGSLILLWICFFRKRLLYLNCERVLASVHIIRKPTKGVPPSRSHNLAYPTWEYSGRPVV